MRSITALLAALARARARRARAPPAPSPSRSATASPMGAAGWSAKADAGALCGFEGDRHRLPECRDAARAQRLLLPLQRARRRADHGRQHDARLHQGERGDGALRVLVRRASQATRCAAAAAARPRTRSRRAAPTGSRWGSTTRAPRRSRSPPPRANNVVFASGWVTLSDPTAPGLAANGPAGVQTGLSAVIQWEVWTPRAARPPSPTRSTAARRIGLRAQACSWLCGAGRERQRRDRPLARSPTDRMP